MILMTNDSLMKVESLAECSHSAIFWPALSDNWSWNHIFGLFRVAVLHRFYCTHHLCINLLFNITWLYICSSNGHKIVIFGLGFQLRPCFVCASSAGSGETVWMRKISWTFAARWYIKYHHFMNCFICTSQCTLSDHKMYINLFFL